MKILRRSSIVYSFDKKHRPAVMIDAGEVLRVETYDARTGTVRSSADLCDVPSPGGGNPVTGPIWVIDAQPGDSLAVEILSIVLGPVGFVSMKPGTGLLGHRATHYQTMMGSIKDGKVAIGPDLQIPVRPMVGVMGTTPSGEAAPTILPGAHGGNMDNRFATTGAIVHLPVEVPGALLAIGDVHASMGDGEITKTGLEICSDVTLRVNLVKGVPVHRAWIETPTMWVTTGDSLDPVEALRTAAEEMTGLLQRFLNVSFETAYMLVSIAGDVQICQMCAPGGFPVTARTVFPRIGPNQGSRPEPGRLPGV